MTSRHDDDRERASRRGSQDETVQTPRGDGSRSIHDRLGGRERPVAGSPPRKRTTSVDEDNGLKRRRLSATNVKPTEDDPKLLQRSRRMFGALMGHLGRAKKQLAQDSDLLQKQDRLLNAAEAKEKQQSQKVSTITQQRSARRKVESQIASYKRAAADKIAKLERKHALSISTERHQARFLQTVSPIPIFYLPARHTKETQALVDASTEAIEEKIQVERREIDAKKRDIELDMKRKLDALEAAVVAVDTKLSDKHHDDTSSQVDADDDAPPTRTLDDVTCAHTTAAPPADVEVSSPKTTPSSPATKPSSPVKNPLSPVNEPSSPVHGAALVDVPTSSSAIPDEATTEHCDVVATVCDTVDLSIEGRDDDDDEDVEEVIVPSKLKVVELRKALKDRGLDTKGLKDDLVKRLELALQK